MILSNFKIFAPSPTDFLYVSELYIQGRGVHLLMKGFICNINVPFGAKSPAQSFYFMINVQIIDRSPLRGQATKEKGETKE